MGELNLDVYVITDPVVSKLSHVQQARLAIAGGADVIQLRDKEASGADLVSAGMAIRGVVPESKLFIVNDRVDVAYAVGADGVHLGQEDIPVKYAREMLGADAIIGVSASSVEEAIHAERDGADYVGLGSIYPTTSKEDAGEAIGLEAISRVKQEVGIPVVAIGGINIQNAPDVVRAGADGVAVISAVVGAKDPESATRQLRDAVLSAKR